MLKNLLLLKSTLLYVGIKSKVKCVTVSVAKYISKNIKSVNWKTFYFNILL
jgi:hypothetical protein